MRKRRREDKKQLILDLIEKHPDGLTIQGVAKLGNMSRITASIYLHELLGEGKIVEKRVGVYRIFFPRRKLIKEIKDWEILKKLRKKLK